MALTTPLATRWQRAQQIDPANIRPLGPGRFLVPSQQQADGYTVQITLNSAGRLTAATCACSDFRQGRATAADLHGVRVCKHILAAANKARQQQPITSEEAPMTSAVIPDITFIVNPFPQPGTPVWDEGALEWTMRDEDDQVYWGDTPTVCLTRYHEQQSRTAEHARKSGCTILELRDLCMRDRDWANQQLDERPY